MDAASGMDAIAILSVSRRDRQAAFDVNSLGVYNALKAAKAHGIRRIVNTGPRGQLARDRYAEWDFDLNPEMPPQPGRTLYWITKGLGLEMARVYTVRLEKAQKEGQIRAGSAYGQAWALMGMASFLGLRYPVWEGTMPPDDVMDAAVAFIRGGLAPEWAAAGALQPNPES
jgi:hypothetical protein